MVRSTHSTGTHQPPITDHVEAVSRRIARTWTLTAVATFSLLGLTIGIPHGPDLEPWEQAVQLATLALLAVGGAVAWRSEGLGGAIMLIGSGALWGMSALEHQPGVALLPALLFAVPAVGFLVAWKRTRSLTSLVVVAMAVVIVLGIGGTVAYAAYQRGYGPSHPQSQLPDLPETPVVWIWSGAVTPESAAVVARIDTATTVTLAVSAENGNTSTVEGSQNGNTWRFTIADLDPTTTYTYYPVVDGLPVPERSGQFTTFSDGPLTFTVAAASCARVGSNGTVYETIASLHPDLFLSTGDLFYADFVANAEHFELAYELSLGQPAQALMYATMPMAYVWDDHDLGRNDANSTTETKPLALAAYLRNVPHYPLAADDGVYQTFSIGRVQFVLLDERSYRDPQTTSDGPDKTMLGTIQLEWLKNQLLAGKEQYALTVLVSQVPWIAPAEAGADHWGGYTYERRVIADFIAANDIHNLLLLAGDSHMVAIDDGSHTDYSSSGNASFPILQAAALDRPGSLKGGPYSEGAVAGGGQFGLITVTDTGAALVVELRGMNWMQETLVSYTFEVAAP